MFKLNYKMPINVLFETPELSSCIFDFFSEIKKNSFF